ncbi:MAG: immune inhibitor A [Planctomycetia bacterium]|nr:immune inhibitor A [Planctomycetia bacterium]
MKFLGSLLALAILAIGVSTASAQITVFSQNFESGLGGLESVSGSFLINNTGFSNNGTNMMGHATTYSSDEYSFYQITGLVLPAFGPITMTFDYVGQFETHFDRFNVQASVTGGLNPPNSLLNPTATSGMQFIDLDHDHHPLLGQFAYDTIGASGGASGVAEFDLSAFAGQTVDIRFQFGSDGSVEAGGFGMDNLSIVAVPEPATIALIVTALVTGGGVVHLRRKRRKALRFARQ